MKHLLLFILCINMAFANDVKVLKKGEPAPFDGVLFTKELEKDIRNDIIVLEKKNELLTKLKEVNETEIDILTKRLSLYQAKAKELSERETSAESSSFWKNAAYFASGAVLTGLIGYGVIKAYR